MSDTNSNTTIGKYEIVSELGRGGMGVVFKAWEESLHRFVAIKMLGDQLVQDDKVVRRFLQEARAVADLNHPNVVQVYAVDTHEGRPYFAMEYVEGQSLTDLIHASGKIEPARAAEIIREAANGLAAAHGKEVVHRDIKPDNIMLTNQGGVKVVDFGIAKMEETDAKLTATGMLVGTPNYISPEVCLGDPVDVRSDIFSLGIVFFEMLTGRTPFQADSPIDMMTAVVHAEIPDIQDLNPDVDTNIRSILVRMLQKDPVRRYQRCQQIIDDLDSTLTSQNLVHASASEAVTVIREQPLFDNNAAATAANSTQPTAAAADQARSEEKNGAVRWGWVVGLLLIVGTAAGSWFYVGQPQQRPPGELQNTAGGTNMSGNTGSGATEDANSVPAQTGGTGASAATDSKVAQISQSIEQGVDEPAVDDMAVGDKDEPVQMSAAAADQQVEVADQQVEANVPVQQVQTSDTTSQQPADNQIALVTKPQPPQVLAEPVRTGPPKLVVVVSGDPAVASTVESVLEAELTQSDFEVLDEQFFRGFGGGGFGIDLPRLSDLVGENGGDILVYADVQEQGQRQLNYYGRRQTQFIASVQVRAVDVRQRRGLGGPWTGQLEYVPLNATDVARETAQPIAQDLVEQLQRVLDSN